MKKKMLKMDTWAAVVSPGDRIEIANYLYVVVRTHTPPNTNFIRFELQSADKPLAFVELWIPQNYLMLVYSPEYKS